MDKLKKIRELLVSLNADAAVLTSFPSRIYFSGFKGSDGCVFITKDEQYIITDSRYTLQVYDEAKDFTLISGYESNFELLLPIIKKCNISKVAFENNDMTVSRFELLKETLNCCEFINLDNRLTTIRRTKTRNEVKSISEALKLSEYALEQTVQKIKEGMTEVQVAAILESYMRSGGAEKLAFETVCVSGARSALPHGAATDKKLEKGDFLTLDFGCVIDGYCSDITRTFVVGNPSELQKEIYDTVLSAHLYAEKMISPGVRCSEADEFARKIIISKGYGINFGHSLGHGVGIQVHELPNLSPRSDSVLTAGDVVTVEPGIYIEDLGGVRIEDMVYISEDKPEILTNFTKELIII